MTARLRWTDNHCHLEPGQPAADAVAAAAAAGVERMIVVGTDADQSRRSLQVAREHPGVVWATAGVHPHDATEGVEGIVALLDEPEVVAIGECGLDYHYDRSPRDVQRRVFAEQVAIAVERDLTLVIHTREAWAETFAILRAEGTPARTVFHCFTGGPGEADECLSLGAHLSFSGIVTFATAEDLRAAAARCPLDRVLVETDSPYLAPIPHRGRRNQPAWLPLVGEAVAHQLGVPAEEIAAATWRNAERVYRLPARPA